MIGDKFASRAGQKGILSRRWADVDMPYSASTGMRPDLIINPHAFPSRMTIGMLMESIASKGAALHGAFVDCSPFQDSDRSDGVDALDSFEHRLEAAGFDRKGKETMICGITGEEMECDIYVGLVYYQRLRHMVTDKYQCRSVGPVSAKTKQPIKGRQFGGGIRFGEMERDTMISHGSSFVILDRLLRCSDWCLMSMCTGCGSLISPQLERVSWSEVERRLLKRTAGSSKVTTGGTVTCRCCGNEGQVQTIEAPYTMGLLVSELSLFNISSKFCSPFP